MNKNDMNLLLRYREIHKERSTQSSPTRTYIAVIAVVSLLLSAFALRLWLDRLSLENDVNELDAYVNSAEVINKLKEVEQLKINNESLDSLIEQTKGINAVFASAVRFDSEALHVIQGARYKEIIFDNISYANGIIYVDIAAPKASDASNYVLRLERENYFKDVSYSGYTFHEEDKLYRTTIMCTMFGGNLE